MLGAKEVRNQIKSIENTRKITKAMEMVAASKMRRAQDRMRAARPYAQRMRIVVSHLMHAHFEYKHPYLIDRKVKRVGFILVSTDRGLCGGLNINLFRKAIEMMDKYDREGVEIDVTVIGKKALGFFKRLKCNIVSDSVDLGDKPKLIELVGAVKVMMDHYMEGKIDRLFVISNEFVNTMTQKPNVEQLLPICPKKEEVIEHYWDYIYEPESKAVIDTLLARYIDSLVYQAVSENTACEQSARMVAMKAATDNAGNLIDDLKLIYNKARQATITQELSEIVAGAAAV